MDVLDQKAIRARRRANEAEEMIRDIFVKAVADSNEMQWMADREKAQDVRMRARMILRAARIAVDEYVTAMGAED